MQLKPNDFIYTPDEETFNKAVAAFVEAGAELDESWCSFGYWQTKNEGVEWLDDNDIVSTKAPSNHNRIVSLADLQGEEL